MTLKVLVIAYVMQVWIDQGFLDNPFNHGL